MTIATRPVKSGISDDLNKGMVVIVALGFGVVYVGGQSFSSVGMVVSC